MQQFPLAPSETGFNYGPPTSGFMPNTDQLPDISRYLVTEVNPARSNNTLDYERCAILHNYIVQYSWVAEGNLLSDFTHRSFFEHYGDEAEVARERLHPSLVAFLEAIYLPEDGLSSFFLWAKSISSPSEMWAYHDSEMTFGYEDFLTLYQTNRGLQGFSHHDGLNYNQNTHRATMAMAIEDQEFTRPVEDHEDLWFPLESVLSNWIHMIQIGKITVASNIEPKEYKIGQWIWNSYSSVQIDNTVAAFDRLVSAIEARIPNPLPLTPDTLQLLNNSDLDAASVPTSCFIRSLLTRVKTPRFRYIAPGLLVPHDKEAFIAKQLFTSIDTSSEDQLYIPPVLIFPAEELQANISDIDRYRSPNPFPMPYHRKGDPRHIIPAGLYSESVYRYDVDGAEEGFRLILPFELGKSEGLARKSDGSPLGTESISGLFQHGFKPFGGEWTRAQRLERLFNKWRDLVESGIWIVGKDGVEGGIQTFRNADLGGWKDYWIAPDW